MQPLTNIFNLSLPTGIFPDGWKIAKVSPAFKEGNKIDCGDYTVCPKKKSLSLKGK